MPGPNDDHRGFGLFQHFFNLQEPLFIAPGQEALLNCRMVFEAFEQQIIQVFNNLGAVTDAAGGSLADIVKLTIYLINLDHFSLVNEIMARYFKEPYPARAVIGVAQLPRDSLIEIDAVMVLPGN